MTQGTMTRSSSDPRAVAGTDEPFRLLVESVRDYAIFMLSPEGKVTTWNVGAQRIKGYSADEIIGREYALFFPPEDAATGKPARALSIAASEGRYEEEGWRIRKDGSRFWAHVVLTALRGEDGELRGYAKVTRDMTEQRLANEARRRSEIEIAARQAAEQSEARLRLSEQLYREQHEQLTIVLAGVADGITAQAADGQLLYANDAAAHSCGYPDAEALMRAPLSEILEMFEAHDEHGAPFDWSKLPGRRALAGEESPSALLRIRRRSDNHEWWSMLTSRAVKDENGVPYLAVNIWRDVSAQRRRERESQFLAEASDVLSAGLDADTAMEKLTRLCVPRFADWSVVHVLEGDSLVVVSLAHGDPRRVEELRELQRRFPIDMKREHGAPRVVRTGRSELITDVTEALLAESMRDPERLVAARSLGIKSLLVVPLRARGQTLGALTLAYAESNQHYDEADLVLAEELGRRAALALDNARLYGAAQEAVRARDEFLSIAGHELKTPLAALLLQLGGMLRLHARGDPPNAERAHERLQKSVSQAQRLDKLIDQLLDVSRITSGRLRIEREVFDLGELTEEVVARFAEEAHDSGTDVRLDAGGELRGCWDRLRLDQVLTNLISNAIKYGAGKPITITLAGTQSGVSLAVRDQGIGIPQEHQARIFGRFERAVSERYYGGFGLGLWITRQIVEAHGGTIRLTSQAGAGATFTVELPSSAP
jgi:PAS domain S-box-containing protein